MKKPNSCLAADPNDFYPSPYHFSSQQSFFSHFNFLTLSTSTHETLTLSSPLISQSTVTFFSSSSLPASTHLLHSTKPSIFSTLSPPLISQSQSQSQPQPLTHDSNNHSQPTSIRLHTIYTLNHRPHPTPFVFLIFQKPPRPQNAAPYQVIDTNDKPFIQCKPCSKCYPQTDPIYDPTSSSTYESLTCEA